MTVININPCDCMKEGVIGHVRENEVTQIVFDLSAWISEYGLGTVALSVMRQGDLVPYPVPIAIVDGKATWTVSATDTAKYGRIKAQLTYYVGTKRKKSNIYVLRVRESLAENGQAPEPYESWLEVLQELTAETAASARDAANSAMDAQMYKSDAEDAANRANDHRTDAWRAATAASGHARDARQSKDSAWTAARSAATSADLAGQRARDAGYVTFDVNEETGHLLVYKTSNIDHLDFRVNEQTGRLEVLANVGE